LIFSAVIWIHTLTDILKNDLEGQNDQVFWASIVSYNGITGSILYLIFGTKNKIDV
jgi:hypothetical protein